VHPEGPCWTLYVSASHCIHAKVSLFQKNPASQREKRERERERVTARERERERKNKRKRERKRERQRERAIMIVQSARIAGFRGNPIPLPSSGGSQ